MLEKKRIKKNQDFCLGDVFTYGNNSVVVYEISEDSISCTRTIFSIVMGATYVEEPFDLTKIKLLENLLEFDLNVSPVYINRKDEKCVEK